MAQNRQDDRDRITLDEDRNRAAQTKADTEFLARELAALRVAIGEVATRDYLRGELDRLRGDLEEMTNPEPPPTSTAKTNPGQGQESVQVDPQTPTPARRNRPKVDATGSPGRCRAVPREERS